MKKKINPYLLYYSTISYEIKQNLHQSTQISKRRKNQTRNRKAYLENERIPTDDVCTTQVQLVNYFSMNGCSWER